MNPAEPATRPDGEPAGPLATGAGADERRDAGVATVWAATALAVLMFVLVLGLHLAGATVARHRAESAADLAALAGARRSIEGEAVACASAAIVARAAGSSLLDCRLVGWDVLVDVQVMVPVPLPGANRATGRARAGPVPDPAVGPVAGPARDRPEASHDLPPNTAGRPLDGVDRAGLIRPATAPFRRDGDGRGPPPQTAVPPLTQRAQEAVRRSSDTARQPLSGVRTARQPHRHAATAPGERYPRAAGRRRDRSRRVTARLNGIRGPHRRARRRRGADRRPPLACTPRHGPTGNRSVPAPTGRTTFVAPQAAAGPDAPPDARFRRDAAAAGRPDPPQGRPAAGPTGDVSRRVAP